MSNEIKETVETTEGITETTVVMNEIQIAEHMEQVNAEVEAEKEVLTEVTSVAKEEDKTGQEVPVTAEQMREIAIKDYFGGMMAIAKELPNLSNRGVRRLLIALLQLPHPDEPVKLVSNEERMLFGIGQRVQIARMYLMMESMKENIKSKKEAEGQQVTVPVTTDSNTEEVSNVKSEPTNQDPA